MKIGYYISQYPRSDEPPGYFWGGTGAAAAGLAESMAQLGHEVTVVTSAPGSRGSLRTQRGVKVVECPSWGTLSQARIAPSILWTGLRLNFDLVHAHAGNPPAPFGALGYHLVNDVPLVVTYHGDPQAGYGSPARQLAVRVYQGRLLRILLHRADALFVPSLAFLDDSRLLRSLQREVEELPNGIDLRQKTMNLTRNDARLELGLPIDSHVVLFLGSLNPYKGPEILLEAAELLCRHGSRYLVIFAGDGLLRETLIQEAIRKGMKGRVRFDGFIPEARKQLYYTAADVFVLPSTMSTEVFPITILEAFAHGLPVIVSDLCTFRGFVREGENGHIVPRGNPKALCEAILSVVAKGKEWQALSRGAWLTARTFDWMAIAKSAEIRYMELVET